MNRSALELFADGMKGMMGIALGALLLSQRIPEPLTLILFAAFVLVYYRFYVGGVVYMDLSRRAKAVDAAERARSLCPAAYYKTFIEVFLLSVSVLLVGVMGVTVSNAAAFTVAFVNLMAANCAWLMMRIAIDFKTYTILARRERTREQSRVCDLLEGALRTLWVWVLNNLCFMCFGVALLYIVGPQSKYFAFLAATCCIMNSLVDLRLTHKFYHRPARA